MALLHCRQEMPDWKLSVAKFANYEQFVAKSIDRTYLECYTRNN